MTLFDAYRRIRELTTKPVKGIHYNAVINISVYKVVAGE